MENTPDSLRIRALTSVSVLRKFINSYGEMTDRPVLKAYTAMVPPQFLYGAELLYKSGKRKWDAEEGKCVKKLLTLPRSSMIQAIRIKNRMV